MPTNYPEAFESLLRPIATAGKTIGTSALFSSPLLGTVKHATKMSHLKKFISANREFVGVVEGVLPDSSTIFAIIEERLGEPINEANVVAANQACSEIITKISGPVVASFVRDAMGQHIDGNILRAPMDELIKFLTGEFASFSKSAGNGLASIAGSTNEGLLIACLEQAGLVPTKDFTKTGDDSRGDIVVHSHVGTKRNLGVEVKSYHARERLPRGLHDIDGWKVRAGYFVAPEEFGQKRTMRLLLTHAAAIYLPGATLAKLNDDVRDIQSNAEIAYQSRFYRPLERFASDMLFFSKNERLPKA